MTAKTTDMGKACDKWLADRGFPKLTFQQSNAAQAALARLRKQRLAETNLERMAEEIEEGQE